MLSSAWQLGCSISPQFLHVLYTLSSQRCISPSLLSFHHTPTSHILTHDTSHTLPQHISHPHMHTSHTLSHAHISHPLTCTHLTPSHMHTSHTLTCIHLTPSHNTSHTLTCTHLTPSHNTSHTLTDGVVVCRLSSTALTFISSSSSSWLLTLLLCCANCCWTLELSVSAWEGERKGGESSGKWEGMRGWEEGRRGRDM